MEDAERMAQGKGGPSVYVKRIKEGYTWSVFVPALDTSEAGLLEAVRLCRVTDGELRESFPTPVLDGPARPSGGGPSKPRKLGLSQR